MNSQRRPYAPTPIAIIAQSALRKGPLIQKRNGGGQLCWYFGQRTFSGGTVSKLIAAGIAVRDGNQLILASTKP